MTDVLPTRSQVLQACRGDTTPDHPLLRAARTLTVLHERRFATIPYPDEHCAPGMHVFERRRATPRASPFDTGEHHVRDAGVTARGLVVHRDPTADIDADRTRHIRAIDRWAAAHLPPAHGGAYLHSETLGTVFDRLARHTAHAYAALADDAGWDLWFAWERLAELAVAYEDLAAELSTGRRRLPTAQ